MAGDHVEILRALLISFYAVVRFSGGTLDNGRGDMREMVLPFMKKMYVDLSPSA